MATATAQDDLSELLSLWWEDEVAFCAAINSPPPTPQQRRIWAAVREGSHTTVRSGNGTGKDWSAARIGLWYLLCKGLADQEAIVITTGPKESHLKDVIWGEIRSAIGSLHDSGLFRLKGLAPRAMILRPSAEHPKWFMTGLVANSEAAFSGYRAANVFIIADEAAGIPPHVWDAIYPMISGENHRLLVIGNPTNPSGGYYETFRNPVFRKIRLSSREAAEYGIPGGASEKMIADLERAFGATSAYVRAHVDAEFPDATEDQTIPLHWIEEAETLDPFRGLSAHDREVVEARLLRTRAMGVDPSEGGGGDRSVIVVRDAQRVLYWESSTDTSPMALAERVADLMERWRVDPSEIRIDSIGNNVAGRLSEIGIRVDRFNGGERARRPKLFANRRAESFWSLREAINPEAQQRFSLGGEPCREVIAELRAELLAQEHTLRSDKLIQMIHKDKIRAKLHGRSPDYADALAMSFSPRRIAQAREVKARRW